MDKRGAPCAHSSDALRRRVRHVLPAHDAVEALLVHAGVARAGVVAVEDLRRDLDLGGLIEDDNGMELLVAGSIVKLDLTVAGVYEQVWARSAAGQGGYAACLQYCESRQ